MRRDDAVLFSTGLTAAESVEIDPRGLFYSAEVVRISGLVDSGEQVVRRVDGVDVLEIVLVVWRRWWMQERPIRVLIPRRGTVQDAPPFEPMVVYTFDVVMNLPKRRAVALRVCEPPADVSSYLDEVAQRSVSLARDLDPVRPGLDAVGSLDEVTQRPAVVVGDPTWGSFRLSAAGTFYVGSIELTGEVVRLRCGFDSSVGGALEHRLELLSRLPELLKKAHAFLLEWLSEPYLAEDLESLRPVECLRRIELVEVSIDLDSSVSFWFQAREGMLEELWGAFVIDFDAVGGSDGVDLYQ